mmetsp:Transcript_20744/g.57606  ORF Transcript_20744/g.57606 Transcript_20744/m.57606 type:complete len:409 (-) Transcript_20744:663-1889(-)
MDAPIAKSLHRPPLDVTVIVIVTGFGLVDSWFFLGLGRCCCCVRGSSSVAAACQRTLPLFLFLVFAAPRIAEFPLPHFLPVDLHILFVFVPELILSLSRQLFPDFTENLGDLDGTAVRILRRDLGTEFRCVHQVGSGGTLGQWIIVVVVVDNVDVNAAVLVAAVAVAVAIVVVAIGIAVAIFIASFPLGFHAGRSGGWLGSGRSSGCRRLFRSSFAVGSCCHSRSRRLWFLASGGNDGCLSRCLCRCLCRSFGLLFLGAGVIAGFPGLFFVASTDRYDCGLELLGSNHGLEPVLVLWRQVLIVRAATPLRSWSVIVGEFRPSLPDLWCGCRCHCRSIVSFRGDGIVVGSWTGRFGIGGIVLVLVFLVFRFRLFALLGRIGGSGGFCFGSGPSRSGRFRFQCRSWCGCG